jgi:ribosomal subunit interface protein
MQITITGQQVQVGEALREYARTRLGEGVGKYFDGAIVGHVAFSREGPLLHTHIQVRIGRGMTWESHAEASDIKLSFSSAVDHIEKQLRRHKRKRRGHTRRT